MSDSTGTSAPIGLIGGIGMTEVRVYTQRPAPDGLYSGCPHVHAIVDEAYYVLSGSGMVEFHDPARGMRTLPLEIGAYVHFPPMVMHRLISTDQLVILGLMSAAGLAEKGEARVYFGRAVDEDPAEFARLMALPLNDGLEGALARRDAAVAAYQILVALWQTDRQAYNSELQRFFAVHRAAMTLRRDEFAKQLASGPTAWSQQINDRLELLPDARPSDAEVFQNLRGTESGLGMCGVLRPMLELKGIS